MSFQSLIATGTVFPGYAGTQPVLVSSVLNVSAVPSSIPLTFSNVPVGNNEWVTVDIVAYDGPNGTGSHIDLGQLAGLINIGAPSTSGAIDQSSTNRFQVALAAMSQGILSTYDLQNETSLDADIGTLTSGSSPASSTGLYVSSQLLGFVNTLYQSYNRTITASASGGPAAVATITYGYTDPTERSFVYNVNQTIAANNNTAQLGSLQAGSGSIQFYIIGSPFNSVVQAKAHTPTTSPPPTATQTVADAFDVASGSVRIQHVYGGKILVGMQSAAPGLPGSPTFAGGLVPLNGRPQTDTSAVTVPIATSQVTMTMTDPQAAAFGTAPYYAEQAVAGNGLITACTYAGSRQCNIPTSAITGISGSAVSVAFATYNPFGFPSSVLQVCAGLDCFPLVDKAVNAVRAPFYDAGTNLQYYAWTPSAGAITSVVAAPSGGYTIAYSAGTTGSIQTSTSAWFYPQQNIDLNSDAPPGTVLSLTLTCSGQTVRSTAVQQSARYASFYVTDLAGPAQCASTNIGFNLPSGSASSGSITISSIGSVPVPFL